MREKFMKSGTPALTALGREGRQGGAPGNRRGFRALLLALATASCLPTAPATNRVQGHAGVGGTAGAGGVGGTAGAGGEGGTAGTGGVDDGRTPAWLFETNECPGAAPECGPRGKGCVSARAPGNAPRPAPSASSSKELPPIYSALRRMRVGGAKDDEALTPASASEEEWGKIGFDLDQTCTRATSCIEKGRGTRVDVESCQNAADSGYDGAECRDNFVGALFTVGAETEEFGAFGISEQHWNCGLRAGAFNILTKLSGYNGEANDDSVRLDLYTSVGRADKAAVRDCLDESKWLREDWVDFTNTSWRRSTRWRIAERSLAAPTGSFPYASGDVPDAKVADANAFVRDGWMVAHLPPNSELWLNGQHANGLKGLRFQLNRGVLAARIVQDPATKTWSVNDGLIGGVVGRDDILMSFWEIGFCPESVGGTYDVLLPFVERGDILLDPNAPSSAECDAFSLGISFSAAEVEADAADIEAVDSPKDLCSHK